MYYRLTTDSPLRIHQGQQGGSLLKALQSNPDASSLSIRAIVRDPTAASQKLSSKSNSNLTFHKANLTDKSSLIPALTDVDTAFLITIPQPNAEAEITQGKAFIDAAKETGLKHIIFSSVGSAERNTGIPHFDSKRVVEKYIIESGIPYTFIRPVAFMDNFPVDGGVGRFFALGLFNTALAGKRLQLIAAKDIGEFAAKAALNPEKWKGREFELAGDELSLPEVLDVYEKVQGTRPWSVWLPYFALKLMLPVDFFLMFKFFYDDGYKANIPDLKKEYPGLQTFEDFLREKAKSKDKTA
ncbi:hypothetical protein TWF106_007710 [Orbilia oligospora]|uniref:NmrA-like domain-containing protein n=1 Tax=Orbilia oligospora TaxID=2813651 RepID=A0A7C8UP52_ORBOL|nr:hypothetical protein TWF788_001686 [Orbilia oligospora]KAF3218115.1 hypothetical protein TWF106_007710 [Orbilia oligospora]